MRAGTTIAWTGDNAWYHEITWPQWKALLAAWCVWGLDAFDFLILTYVLVAVAATFHVPLAVAGTLFLATYGVRWFGGLVFGSLSDRIGRKVPLAITLAWFSICAVLTGSAWSFVALFAFRLLLGVGMAPGYSVGVTLVAESWPERYRAIGVGLQDMGWGFGGIAASLAFLWLYPIVGWRGLFFVGVIPALVIGVFILRAVPESPVWEQQRARHQLAAIPALQLFRRNWALVIFLAVLMFSLFFSNWPTLGLLPTYLKSLRVSHAEIAALGLVSSVGQVFGYFASGFLADYFGRRKGLALMIVIGTLCVLLYVVTAGVFWLAAAFVFLAGLFLIGSAGIWGSILAEHFSTDVRSSAVGFLYNIGAAGGGAAPAVVLGFVAATHIGFGAALVGATVVASGVALVLLTRTRETRGVDLATVGDGPRGAAVATATVVGLGGGAS